MTPPLPSGARTRSGGRAARRAARAAPLADHLCPVRAGMEGGTYQPLTQGDIRQIHSAVLDALEKLRITPYLYIPDAHGWSHPRRMGLACHLGVLLDRPSIGCAKSRLVGTHNVPPEEAGAWVHLYDDGEVIGAVVRTRTGVSPVYVSVGHRIDLASAVEVVLRCCRGYRLPETTRWAHRVAGGEVPPLAGLQPTLF